MKKIICLLILFFSIYTSKAQQQWKFHIAFEDATGARDTIWVIWDSTAHGTFPIDTALGEGLVHMDYSKFNVFTGNQNSDTTKTEAYPFDVDLHMVDIYAINCQYPFIIRWDTSLFSRYFSVGNPYITYASIQNAYFYFQNNDPPLQAYNMLIDDTAYAPPFGSGYEHFPMTISIERGPSTISINETSIFKKAPITFFPNPVNDKLFITSLDKIKELNIYSEDGKNVCSEIFSEEKILSNYQVQLPFLEPGFYILESKNNKNQMCHEKIIKSN